MNSNTTQFCCWTSTSEPFIIFESILSLTIHCFMETWDTISLWKFPFYKKKFTLECLSHSNCLCEEINGHEYKNRFHKLYLLERKRDSFVLICIWILLLLLIITSDKWAIYAYKGTKIFVQSRWPSDEDGATWSSSATIIRARGSNCVRLSLSLWLWVKFPVGQSLHVNYPLCPWAGHFFFFFLLSHWRNWAQC